MRKKALAMVLTVALSVSMSMTAFAASSTTTSNSGSQTSSSESSESSESTSGSTVSQAKPTANTSGGVSVSAAKAGERVNTDTVTVTVAGIDGSVSAVNLTAYVERTEASVISAIAQATATGTDAGATVSQLMTTPASPMFTRTINALGGKAAINNCGTVKTAAIVKDAFGNTIASAGTIKGVTSGSLVMLMSVNADGTVEFVEGVVDPVTGMILGAFKGTPTTISVLVFVPAV